MQDRGQLTRVDYSLPLINIDWQFRVEIVVTSVIYNSFLVSQIPQTYL